MAQKKFDGVIDSVRYTPDGKLQIIRVYERRGPTFTDRILLSRQELIDRLKAKKHFFVGRRLPYLASTFDLGEPIRLAGAPGQEVLLVGDSVSDGHDHLQNIPQF